MDGKYVRPPSKTVRPMSRSFSLAAGPHCRGQRPLRSRSEVNRFSARRVITLAPSCCQGGNSVVRRVEGGKLASRSGRVTLKTLAAHVALSPSTVSLVLNSSPVADAIPQVTKDRIFAAARELDYRPDFVARSLRRQRSLSIGVLVSEISGGYSAEVVSGVERTLVEAGYFGLVASHYFDLA